MLNKFIQAVIAAAFLSSCASNYPVKSLNVVLKSEVLKFKGQGFLTHFNDELRLDLYLVGNFSNSLKIKENKICIDKKCYKKQTFNEQFFGKIYYKDLLSDILQCKSIFSKKNYQKNNEGFVQNIDEISYEKIGQKCVFKKGKLLIKISIY